MEQPGSGQQLAAVSAERRLVAARSDPPLDTDPPFRLAAVVLAAGASSRMGQPKPLLPWGGKTILEHLIAVWRQLNAVQVGVVCAAHDQAIQTELDRIEHPPEDRIINLHSSRGMFSSIQTAAGWPGWKSSVTHWALVLGDQPQLSATTLGQLLHFTALHPDGVCQPSRKGRGRHPVILPQRVFDRLRDAPQANLKQFLTALTDPVRRCEIDDPALDVDLDTPDAYQEALRSFTPAPPFST